MYAPGHLVLLDNISLGDIVHLHRQGAPRFDDIEGVPVITLVPIERFCKEVRVHIIPRKRREEVQRLGVHLVEVDSVCSEERY